MSDSHGSGEDSSHRNSNNGHHSRSLTPNQGQSGPSSERDRHRPGPSGFGSNGNSSNGHSSVHRFVGGNSNASHHYGNGGSNGGSQEPGPRAGSSGSGSSNGRPPSQKRGRDRSRDSSCGGRTKFQKDNSGAQSGKGRKKREEFIDQIVTRPENAIKQAPSIAKDTNIEVVANYFRVSSREISVTGYRVDFTPETDVPGIRRRLILQNKTQLGAYVFDGGNEIFLLRPLEERRVELQGANREGDQFAITLRMTGTVRFTEARFLQILNLVLRNGMRGLNLQLVGRNFYDADSNVVMDIPQFRLQIWPGYDTSIRQHENELLLNCDTCHKVMRHENVLSFIKECLRANGGDYRKAAGDAIINSTVLTDYNNATYKICEIDWDRTPGHTFPTRNGPVSFADYYRNKYQLVIRDLKQPLLMSKASARNIRAGQPKYIALVPELCRMTGLTDADKNNTNLMRVLADRTRMTPTQRVSKLEAFSRRINDTPACRQVFTENSMQVDRKLVRFGARRFETETLYKGQDFENPRNKISLSERADWTREIQKVMFKTVLGVELKNWFFVFPAQYARIAESFMQSFKQAAEGFLQGRRLNDPTFVQINDQRAQTYERQVRQIIQSDPSFIMVVIPFRRDEVYKTLKKLTVGEAQARPVAIQVVTDKTCGNNRNLLSIATKIAIQVNCKLGGVPWSVDLRIEGLMIVGFDISIGKKGKGDTYGAMVASLNPQNNGGHYFSMAKRHTDGALLANNFGVMIQAALARYRECNNGALPERILIYRDGVSDGDLAFVNHQEVENVRRAVASMYGGEKEERLAFIIVNKKTNTRIMQKAREGAREPYSNPLPGTVIDDVITLPERIDFYLISQAVNQGTVSPVYYNVLFNNFFPNHAVRGLQQLSYKLCHNYFNWTGTVRIPSVVQYAKKLAMLAQDTLNGAPSEQIDMKRQLYFL